MLSIFEIISLGLTVPTLCFAFLTIKHWGIKPVITAWRREAFTSTDWVVIGITVGFVGMWWDNAYWSVPWTFSYLESDHASWWFKNGVVSNTFFRQGLGVIAGYCHYRAYLVAHPKLNGSRATSVLIGSMIAGCVFMGVLIAIKAFG